MIKQLKRMTDMLNVRKLPTITSKEERIGIERNLIKYYFRDEDRDTVS